MLIQNRQTVTSQPVCMKRERRTETVVTDGRVGEPALSLLHLARDGVGGVTHPTPLSRGDSLTTQVLQLLELLLNASGQGHRLGTVALGTTSCHVTGTRPGDCCPGDNKLSCCYWDTAWRLLPWGQQVVMLLGHGLGTVAMGTTSCHVVTGTLPGDCCPGDNKLTCY